jgi:hypothetical protein
MLRVASARRTCSRDPTIVAGDGAPRRLYGWTRLFDPAGPTRLPSAPPGGMPTLGSGRAGVHSGVPTFVVRPRAFALSTRAARHRNQLNVVDLEMLERRPDERPARLTMPAAEPLGRRSAEARGRPDRVSSTGESLRGLRLFSSRQACVGSQSLMPGGRGESPTARLASGCQRGGDRILALAARDAHRSFLWIAGHVARGTDLPGELPHRRRPDGYWPRIIVTI